MKRVAVLCLLVVVVFSGCGLPSVPTALELVQAPQAAHLSGALRVAAQMDIYGDYVGGLAPHIERTPGAIQAFAVEIVPYFYYERISALQYLPPIVPSIYPQDRNFHVAGSFILCCGKVTLNIRFFNRFSPRWYNTTSILSTLVHELGHAQGVVPRGQHNDIAEMEAMNQLATLEVLAAMVRDGNPYALPAFIRMVQGLADDYAWSLSLETGRMGRYESYLHKVIETAYGWASYYRAMDHWAKDMDTLKYILGAYGRLPYKYLLEAMNTPGYWTRRSPYYPNPEGRIQMNDTAYVLEHLDGLVRAYRDLLEKYDLDVEGGE